MSRICTLPIKRAIKSMVNKGADLTKIKSLGLAINEETDNIEKIATITYLALTAKDSIDVSRILAATTENDLSLMENSEDSAEIKSKEKFLSDTLNISSVADLKVLLESAASSTIAEPLIEDAKERTVVESVTTSENKVLVDARKQPAKELVIDGISVGLHTFRQKREKALKGIKAKRDIQWSTFLDIYFPGMSQYGLEFKMFVDEYVLNGLMTFKPGEGFAKSIDKKINSFKDDITATSESLSLMNIGDYSATSLNTALIDTVTRNKYFNDVLLADFNFIIQTVSGIIIADTAGEGAKAKNTSVVGLVDPENDDIVGGNTKPMLLDLSSISVDELLMIGTFNNDGDLEIVENLTGDIDEHGVNPIIAEDTGTERSFYKESNSDKIFYIDSNGVIHEVTTKTAYTVNSVSNRNESSIDHSIDALAQDTAFIKNVFTMFRTINPDMTFGPRMSYKDYLKIAPLLIENKNDLILYLKELADARNGRLSTIARSLYYQVFAPNAVEVGSETITSLATIANTDVAVDGLINPYNEDIVKALFVALTSKEQLRYVTINNEVTRVTKKASDRDFSFMINEEFAGRFLKGAIVREDISERIRVLNNPGGDIAFITLDGIEHSVNSLSYGDLPVLAKALNMYDLFVDINELVIAKYGTNSTEASREITSLMKAVVHFIASNKIDGRYTPAKLAGENKGESRGMFLYTAPTSMLLRYKEYLEEALQPDMSKQQTVAGEKRASSTPGNREAQLPNQIKRYDETNKYNEIPTTFNAFIKSNLSGNIPHAEYGGAVIKTAIMVDGKPLRVSQWPFKLRVEHGLIEGFFKMPRGGEIGNKFFLQPIGYSDKQNIPMHEINVPSYNFLGVGKAVTDTLRTAFISYQTEKYESLQRITLTKAKDFVGSNFNHLNTVVNNSKDTETMSSNIKNLILTLSMPGISSLPAALRLQKAFEVLPETTDNVSIAFSKELRKDALMVLRDVLVNKMYGNNGDMIKVANSLLEVISLPTDVSINMQTGLDEEADYVTNLGGKFILKPTSGVRAAMYRNDGDGMLNRMLAEFNRNVETSKVDKAKISEELFKAIRGTTKTIEADPDILLERMFMINGIYGNSLKVLTMGDESYFDSSTYKNYSDTSDYYSKAEVDKSLTEADMEQMMIKQSKRGQSTLTRGQVYMSKETVVGLKRNAPKGNIINYLEVQNRETGKLVTFPELEGKDLFELEALGIVERIGGAILSTNNGVIVNVGRERVFLSDTTKTRMLKGRVYGEAMYTLIDKAINMAKKSQLMTMARYSPDAKYALGPVLRVDNKPHLEYEHIRDKITELNANKMVTLPDFIPSLVVSDPVSHIDLLQKMNARQENSDAIQYTYPVYDLLFKAARGGKLSGFYSKKAVATKTLTTTFEYDSFRQVLQKKSNQMPFSYEQMSKFGGVEMFSAMEKMGRSIPFPNTWMTVPPVDENGNIVGGDKVQTTIENMHELFEYFGGFKRGNDSVWDDVVKSLVDNSENMFSFYGVLTVPSNQKTGHKNINKWEDVFGTKTIDRFNTSYMAQEYNMEVLSKDHEYDVTEGAAHKSQLTLLSQLVNAVGFGGMSSVEALNLQNAMETMSDIDNFRISNMLADTAESLVKDGDTRGDVTKYAELIKDLREGNMASKNMLDSKIEFEHILSAGMYDIIQKAFNEDLDSPLIKELLGSSRASLDTPAISARVMGVIRSNLFKQIVQVKMAGFIGVVSAAHNTINVYTILETKARVSRIGFVDHHIKNRTDQLIDSVANPEQFTAYRTNIVPTDRMLVDGKEMLVAFVDIDKEFAAGTQMSIVKIPFKIAAVNSIEEWEDLPDSAQITIKNPGGYDITGQKWYIIDAVRRGKLFKKLKTTNVHEGNMNIRSYIKMGTFSGKLKVDTTEDNSLRWYKITDKNGYDINTTEAYRNLYRYSQEGSPGKTKESGAEHTNKLAELNSELITETQRIGEDGKKVWKIEAPEVILPLFSAKAYGVKEGVALHTIIGTDGNVEINTLEYFRNQPKKEFKLETGTKNRKSLLAKYTFLLAMSDRSNLSITANMYRDILIYLKGSSDKHIGVASINFIINVYKEKFDERRAKSFIKMLETTLTRIPGQTKQSGFAGKVIDFLDAQGNATFAPTEHLVNTGGDFDVDTLSVLTKTLDEYGFINTYERFVDDSGVLNNKAVLTEYKNELIRVIQLIGYSIDTHNELVAEHKIILQTKLTALEGRYDALEAHKGTDKYTPVTAKKILAELEKVQKALIRIDSRHLDTSAREKFIDKSAKKVYKNMMNMLSNAMEDGVRSSLMDINTASEVQTPITMSMFTSIINNIKALREREGSTDLDKYSSEEYPLHGESFLANYNIENLNAQGSNAIGIIATSMKMSSAVQVSKYAFDHTKQVVKRNPFVFTSEVSYTSRFDGVDKKITRNDFVDLDRFSIMNMVAHDPQIQQALMRVRAAVDNDGVLQEDIELLKDIIGEEVYKVVEELDKGTKLTLEQINSIARAKINSLFGINMYDVTAKENNLTMSGADMANEFIEC